MNCKTFDRWLEDGLPEPTAAVAHAHAQDCARCAKAFAAWTEVDAMLATPAGRAPSGFTDGVMARVSEARADEAAERRARARWSASSTPGLAWWVDAAAQPASALAMVVAGLLLWQRASLWSFATDLGTGKFALPQVAWIEVLQRPEVAAGVAIGLLPVAAIAGWAFYRLAGRMTAGRMTDGRMRVRRLPFGIAA